MSKTSSSPGRRFGTEAGFHFLNLFQCCPWKFYFRHVLGWATIFEAPALVNGGAFHYGKEVFYKERSEKVAISRMLAFLRESKPSFEYREDYALCYTRLPEMLHAWVRKYGTSDLKNYRFLEIEQEHKISLPGGFFFTSRPDAVVQAKDKTVFVLETKTTGYSANATELGVAFSDQSTAYIASIAQKYKKKHFRIEGVLPDIVFWLKGSRDVEKITPVRGTLVQRSALELLQWRQGTAQLLAEISQKALALKTKRYPPALLFPRNTAWCVSFNRPCEYARVCREDISHERVPHGYRKETK